MQQGVRMLRSMLPEQVSRMVQESGCRLWINSGDWLPPTRFIDSDVYCQKPFREWVEAEDGNVSFVVGIEAVGWKGHNQPVQLCQWVFGAAAGHPILARAIDFIVYRRAWLLPSPLPVANLECACAPSHQTHGVPVVIPRLDMGALRKEHLWARRFLSDRRWVRPEAFQPDVLRTTGPKLFSMAVEEFLEDRCAWHIESMPCPPNMT